MDLLVFPSLWDGMPNALLEAMACGKPVVASAVGGLKEAVEPGGTGVLVAPESLDRFPSEVAALLDDAPRLSRLGRNARTRALEAARGTRMTIVDLKSARDERELQELLSGVERPAVILVPHWGADPRLRGLELANALNYLARQWDVLHTFGANPVLVNYHQPTASGDPAFAIAKMRGSGKLPSEENSKSPESGPAHEADSRN